MSDLDEALLVLFSVSSSQHLWCNENVSLREDLLTAVRSLSNRTLHSPQLEARMMDECSECLECVQAMHGFLLQGDKTADVFFDEGEFEEVVRYLSDLTVRRLERTMAVELQPQLGNTLPTQVNNGLVELLNFAWLLRYSSMYRALESILLQIVTNRDMQYEQGDRCSGLLLLCASANDAIAEWASVLVAHLGLCSTEDDLEYVVEPTLSLLVQLEANGRVMDRVTPLGTQGLVVLQVDRFYKAIRICLGGISPEALPVYCQMHPKTCGRVLQLLLMRCDDNLSEDMISLVSTLFKAAAGVANVADLWSHFHIEVENGAVVCGTTMGSPDQALEMLFAKASAFYDDAVLAEACMGTILWCVRWACQCSPTSIRASIQEMAIKYLLCEFPGTPGKQRFVETASRVATAVIGDACKAKIFPLASESVWALPLVARTAHESDSRPLVEWMLKQGSDRGPQFREVWIRVLSAPSLPYAQMHLALWKGHSRWYATTDASAPQIVELRKLLAKYLNTMIPDPAYWLSDGCFYLIYMLVAVNATLVPAAYTFFNTRVKADATLVRRVFDGALQLLDENPERRLLGLVFRAWNMLYEAALAAHLSMARISDCTANFLGSLTPLPALSKETAGAIHRCVLSILKHCHDFSRDKLSNTLSLFKAAGLEKHQIIEVQRQLPMSGGRAQQQQQQQAPLKNARNAAVDDDVGLLHYGGDTKRSKVGEIFGRMAPRSAPPAPVDPETRNNLRDMIHHELQGTLGGPTATSSAYSSSSSSSVRGGSRPSLLTPQQIQERQREQQRNQGTTGAKFGALRPRVKLAAAKPVERPSVKPALPSRIPSSSSQQEREHRAAQRLIPNRRALLKRVLAWTVEELQNGEPDHSLELRDIPNEFNSASEYQSVFEPLLLAELRAAMQRDLEQEAGSDGASTVSVHLGDVKKTEQTTVQMCLRVHLEPGEAVIPRLRDLWSKDHVVELQPPNDSSAPMLAIVTKISWVPQEQLEEAVVEFFHLHPDRLNLAKNSVWSCRWVSAALVTGSREYQAMMGLSSLPLCNFVLHGRAAGGGSGSGPGSGSGALNMPHMERQFNESQVASIKQCLRLGHGFVLIQGPPGTGKTRTISGLVGALLKGPTGSAPRLQHGTSTRKRILICAPSNKAVDEVCARLMGGVTNPQHGGMEPISVVRVGREGVISDAVKRVRVEELAGARSAQSQQRAEEQRGFKEAQIVKFKADMDELDKRIAELQSREVAVVSLRNSSDALAPLEPPTQEEKKLAEDIRSLRFQKHQVGTLLKNARNAVKGARDAVDENFKRACEEVVRGADVVCTTLSSAASSQLYDLKNPPLEFDAVIIDEATQATELQALIPLHYRSKLCVLVGDTRQLPATVLSKAAAERLFQQSLFERLTRIGVPSTMLRVQYRMNPAIAAFPNTAFYKGVLQHGPGVTARKAFHEHPLFRPFSFVDVRGHETRGNDHSMVNDAEATLVVELARLLVDRFGADLLGGIGLITPYKRQMFKLRSKVSAASFTEAQRGLLDINTIDGFQGCEKDAVIFSCVRSHEGSRIGFLEDVRRLNVAITRARYCLIVIGNAETLSKHETFAALIAHARQTDSFSTEIQVRDILDGRAAMRSVRSFAPSSSTTSSTPRPPSSSSSQTKEVTTRLKTVSKVVPPAAAAAAAAKKAAVTPAAPPPARPSLFVPQAPAGPQIPRGESDPKKRRPAVKKFVE